MDRKEYRAEYKNRIRFGGLKFLVLDRDGYKCQECGKPWQIVHHIDHDPTNHTMENLVSLCRSCHPILHGPLTPEHRAAIQASCKKAWAEGRNKGGTGWKLSPEHVAAIRSANTGRKMSPETMERMKQAKRDWWAQQSQERKIKIGRNISMGHKRHAHPQ